MKKNILLILLLFMFSVTTCLAKVTQQGLDFFKKYTKKSAKSAGSIAEGRLGHTVRLSESGSPWLRWPLMSVSCSEP